MWTGVERVLCLHASSAPLTTVKCHRGGGGRMEIFSCVGRSDRFPSTAKASGTPIGEAKILVVCSFPPPSGVRGEDLRSRAYAGV